MPKSVWATFHQGKIELLEDLEISEGSRVLVTLLPDKETDFWVQTSQPALDNVWNNEEDDIYAQLLKA
jgi:hypothetical protein